MCTQIAHGLAIKWTQQVDVHMKPDLSVHTDGLERVLAHALFLGFSVLQSTLQAVLLHALCQFATT